MSVGAASSQIVSCSQKTQAAITTSARGSQCALTLFVNASSQTGKNFPAGDMHNDRACVLEKFSASGDDSDFATKDGFHACSCRQRSGNTGNFCTDGKKMFFGGKLYSCLYCEQPNHENNHGEGCATMTLYICTICKKAFRKKRSLGQHIRVHSSKDSHICGTSNKKFTYSTTLVISESARFGKSSVIDDSLVAHERLHSDKAKPHACGIRQKSFTGTGNLVKHERQHSGERPNECSICQKGFLKRRQLTRHVKSHYAERPYVCNICNKRFIGRSDLVSHERLHSGERTHVCSTCNKSFNRRHQLHQLIMGDCTSR